MFGPLFLIPGLAAMSTMAASFNTPTRGARALVIGIGMLAVVVPLALEQVGDSFKLGSEEQIEERTSKPAKTR